MWLEIICGIIIYQLFRRFFYGGNDVLDVETSDFNAIFSVANRLEKLCGGKVYVGLNIPDADTGSRKSIDIVLVTKGEAAVISVKNVSGFVSINDDGSWTSEGGRSHRKERIPDPVAEAKNTASVLESYLEQRGVTLPEGYFSYKVIIPNPNFREIYRNFPPEVITYDQWVQLEPGPKGMISGWVKGAFRGGKKEMQDSFHQQLNFILSTAPMWDRLELKGSKHVLGEFLEFKGKQEDTLALRNIKRSKVGHMAVQKTSMLGLAHSKLQVVYYPRDYRSEGVSASECREVEVRSSTEVIFHPQNSTKVRKYKLSSISSMSLSA
ncbi:hypothetical protein ERO13_D08G241200v2 [Gossypium hirsutum]|uniref:NERD domain-containing protein n=1 Tax=Gossypium hirsutum TaxID=3635 RepID=A0A1U8JT01_GOSHI|nr:uncharacterized protein LOC107909050 [Gossypium hirsutum]KAG4135829.1 hypothetical protein ERO13_D08G241200v2 [Gossypium hirsutum]